MNKLENIKEERQARLNLEDEIRAKIYKNVLNIDRIIEEEVPNILIQYIEEDSNYKRLVTNGRISFELENFKIKEVNDLLNENNILSSSNKVYECERSKYIKASFPCTGINSFTLSYQTFEKLVSSILCKYELKLKQNLRDAEITF